MLVSHNSRQARCNRSGLIDGPPPRRNDPWLRDLLPAPILLLFRTLTNAKFVNRINKNKNKAIF